MARRLVMLVIPIGIVQRRRLDVSTRRIRTPGATYSLPLPLGAGADGKIDRRQGRARRYLTSAPVPASLPIPRLILLLVIRPKSEHIQRADGWCVEFLVTLLRGHQICPAAGSIRACQDTTRNSLMIDPPKATKGRRMSKKTRKKTLKKAPQDGVRQGASRRIEGIGQNASREEAAGESRQAGRQRPANRQRPKRPKLGQACRNRQRRSDRKPRQSPRPAAKANSKAAPKSESAAASKSAARVRGTPLWPRAPRRPPSACRATAATTVSLSDFAGQKLVLFFYPRADTPGCTKEAIDFTRLAERICRKPDRGARRLGRPAKGPGSLSRQARTVDSSRLG